MKKTYRINNIDCPNCAAKIESRIKKLEGVLSCEISFLSQRLTLETETDDQSKIIEEAVRISRKVEPDCEIV